MGEKKNILIIISFGDERVMHICQLSYRQVPNYQNVNGGMKFEMEKKVEDKNNLSGLAKQ